MTLGRTLRIDDGLRRDPNARWQVPLFIHTLFAGVTGMTAFLPPPVQRETNDLDPRALALGMVVLWVFSGVLIEWLFFGGLIGLARHEEKRMKCSSAAGFAS